MFVRRRVIQSPVFVNVNDNICDYFTCNILCVHYQLIYIGNDLLKTYFMAARNVHLIVLVTVVGLVPVPWYMTRKISFSIATSRSLI